MPKVSKTSTEAKDHGPVLEHSDDIGDYTINFVTFRENIDQAPLLKGLPGDACTCPHWGYVIKGQLRFRQDGREEVFEAGDAFYLPPGHVGVGNEPGTEYMQFSPAGELSKVSAAMQKNMQAMQGS
jgi:Cupin domain